MICYDPFWETLKRKNISQYRLIRDFGIDNAQLQRLRDNAVVKTSTIDNLCRILECRVEDIMIYRPDQND
ncbi:MAG: helix-turn-helix transcriptional regulator [Oscillospiraceae bacterium]|nr:helix-turn-helix transcriptional regulator [Oscillospiraceae bacterium]MBR4078451.1 helix-turn-helix transcriptional regulator [Oscillospiraceae bacterium]